MEDQPDQPIVKPIDAAPGETRSAKKNVGLWWKVPLGIIGIIAIIWGIGGLQAWGVYQQALGLRPLVEKTQGNLKSQDLPALKQSLDELHFGGVGLQKRYRQMRWVAWVPVAGSYWKDGDHGITAGIASIEAAQVLTEAVEPYADILGFQGSGSFSGGTAEDRIMIAIETLQKVSPKLDDVAAKLKVVDDNLQTIDESRYPFEVQGKDVSKKLKQAKEIVHGLAAAVTDAKPALDVLPDLAGMEHERKYLVMFHNDGELRGTGGFMTAYGILRVDHGRVYPEQSSDIYDLDAKFSSRLKPPELVSELLKVPYWHLRDMNLSPDFKTNMELFTQNFETVRGVPPIDGVIGVDTNFLVNILKILGPIDVPGFGRFTTDDEPRCNCPQVVYQLELIADRPVATLVENRKGVLGPLMREIVSKAYAAPRAWWDDLFRSFITDAGEKHIVFYFTDPKFEAAAESLDAAGRVKETDGDYLLVSDVNFGGAKANFFVTQDVTQELEIATDGTITKKLTITYINSSPASNCNLEAGQLCLNAPLPNWVRVYVPKGSSLVDAIGLDRKATVSEDLSKTVFEGFLTINPQSSAKTIYTYTLPWKTSSAPATFLVQKQVGKDVSHYKIGLPHRIEEFDLRTDNMISFDW